MKSPKPITVSTSDSLLDEPRLTLREACVLLRIGASSLRRMIADGKIPHIRIGAKIFLLRRDLENLLIGSYMTTKVTVTEYPHKLSLPEEVTNSPHLRLAKS